MSSNPYAAPKAPVADATVDLNDNFIPNGRGVSAGRGGSWIGEAWGLFRQAPGTWIGIIVVLAVIFVAIGLIPVVGSLVTMVLGPIFTAGIMLGCRALDEGGELAFGHLFAGFRERGGTLAAVGAVYLVATVAILFLVVLLTGASMTAMLGGSPDPQAADPGAMMATMGLAFLVMAALMIPLVMAIWLAAPLVVFHEHGAIEAMKASFFGCLKNILPFLVYGILMFVLSIVATIPIGLGWLVLGPVLAASIYTAYRDIYFS